MSIVPLWVKALVIAGIVAAVWAWDAYRINSAEERGRQEVHAAYAKRDAAAAQAALVVANKNAEETARRLRAQKEAQDAHANELARAQADAAGARAAAGRLSSQLAAFTARYRGAPSDPAAVADSKAAGSALDLLADLFSRADEEAGILAEYADAARAAGLQCVRSYEALTP